MALSETNINPRVIVWLRAAKLSLKTLIRRPDGDLVRVKDGAGRCMPWTVVYMLWIQERWVEWATELGFEGDHQTARLAGHSHDEFDAWLNGRY